MLLVVHDQSPHGREVRAGLAGFPGASFQALGDPAARPIRSAKGWVVAADLGRPGAIGAIMHLIQNRDRSEPLVVVAGDGGWHLETLAAGLGASRVIRRGGCGELLRDDVLAVGLAGKSGRRRVATRSAMEDVTGVLARCAAGAEVTSRSGEVHEAVDAALSALSANGIEDWLGVVRDVHDATYRHVMLVLGLAVSFGISMRLPADLLRKLAVGSLLHDLGKARIPLGILDKPGPLTAVERAAMQRHPMHGVEMLKAAGERDADILDCVLSHHELMDGSGYPNRLGAASIRPLTRMVTITDIYAALIEARAYKAPLDRADAYGELRAMGGRLDQGMVASFRAVAFASEEAVSAGWPLAARPGTLAAAAS